MIEPAPMAETMRVVTAEGARSLELALGAPPLKCPSSASRAVRLDQNDFELEAAIAALRQDLEARCNNTDEEGQNHSKPSRLGIVRPSHRHVIWRCRTDRFGTLEGEGSLNEEALELAHYDPRIRMVVWRPLSLQWSNNEGQLRNHTPAFALLRDANLVFMDTVNEDYSTGAIDAAFRGAITRTLAMHGVGYQVWTSSEIRDEARAKNIALVTTGCDHVPDASEREAVLELLRGRPGGLRVTEIAMALSRPHDFIYKLFTMIRRAQLILLAPDEPIMSHGVVVAGSSE